MSTRESAAQSKNNNRQNSLSSTAESHIRKSGKNAGFTGKKLSIFVMVITATLLAMIKAPTLASGTVTQIREVKRAIKQAGFEANIKNAKLSLAQENAMTKIRNRTFGISKQIYAVKFRENILASRMAAAIAVRSVLNFPVKFISAVTGVGEDALGIISTTSKNARITAGALTGTAAGVSENVGATARIVTGSMKNTAKFLGPFAFLFTMVSIMAGATGVSASILKQITSMLNGMMSKGIPVTKSVLIKVFNMMYNDASGKTAPSNRITNITNNKNNNNNTATSTGK